MKGRTQFDTYVESGTVLHNYAHVSGSWGLVLMPSMERFDLIMRLRQAEGA